MKKNNIILLLSVLGIFISFPSQWYPLSLKISLTSLFGANDYVPLPGSEVQESLKTNEAVCPEDLSGWGNKQTIEGIYDFLGIYRFNHRYTNLDQFYINGMKYDDKIVGEGLHTIETNSINSNNYNEFKENVNDILPKIIIEKYNNLNFWKGK